MVRAMHADPDTLWGRPTARLNRDDHGLCNVARERFARFSSAPSLVLRCFSAVLLG